MAWRYGTFIGVVAGVWALLAVSRLVRGEEEAGRSDVLLAAPIRRRGLLARQLVAALAGALVLGLAVALGALGSALPAGGSLLFAAGAASEAMTFGALAALASQLFGERRRAAGWTGIVLGASYLLRAVGDGSNGRAWMVWLSPLGWAERLSPFRDALLVGLVPLIAVPLVLVGASLWLCDHRDVGQGVLTDTGEGRTDTRPMTSPLALDLRLSRGRFLAWAEAMGAYGVARTGRPGRRAPRGAGGRMVPVRAPSWATAGPGTRPASTPSPAGPPSRRWPSIPGAWPPRPSARGRGRHVHGDPAPSPGRRVGCSTSPPSAMWPRYRRSRPTWAPWP